MADMEHPDRIFLRDHVLSAEIGAFQSERGLDQRLRFNLTVDLRETVAGSGDHVDAVLSYDVLTQAVDTALARGKSGESVMPSCPQSPSTQNTMMIVSGVLRRSVT